MIETVRTSTRRPARVASRKRGPVRGGADRVSLLLVFVGVPFCAYLLFVLYPFVQAAYYSMTSWSGFSDVKPFIGVQNFITLFHDSTFLISIRNSVVMLVVLPVVTLVIAFILALLVTVGGGTNGRVRGLRGAGFYRVVAFFPYVVPAIVIGIIWSQVYDPSSGLLNGTLRAAGLQGFGSFAWLGEQRTAMAATIAVIVWAFAGFYMVLFVAAIRGIDTELFEAARLDGAGRLRVALSLVAPSIAGNIRSAYIYMGIVALDAFVYLQAFNPDGGPRNATLVITQQIYQTAFTKGDFGLACAMGIVLAAITFAFVGLVALGARALKGKTAS